MDIIMYKRAMDYVVRLFEAPETITRPAGMDGKSALSEGKPINFPFPRAIPEAVGVESGRLAAFLQELSAKRELHSHLLMIVKDGKVILDLAKYPYRSDVWHVSHSLCKSITALAVGLCVEDGVLSLDEKLFDIFGRSPISAPFTKQTEITVRHLLTMTAGVSFNELGCVTFEDYTEGFFTSRLKFAPGKKFFYNSMNSYMLSAIIRERTGMDMFDLLKERVFNPMGITEVYWEKCPRGITKGGWGLYMKIEDMAKIGQLYLDGGLWQGIRLIPERWIKEATAKQTESSPAMCEHGYGYHIWRSVRKDSYQFNGMLGQNLIIFPDIHMVIACYAGNHEFFPRSEFVSLVGKYFGDSFTPKRRLPSPSGYFALKKAKNVFSEKPEPHSKKKEPTAIPAFLNDKKYKLENRLFLLPVSISVMAGNFTSGFERLLFTTRNGEPALCLKTKSKILILPFTLYGEARYFPLSFGGDTFSVATVGELTEERGTPTLRLTVHFLELTAVREFTFSFGETVTVRMAEIPDGKALFEGFSPLIRETAEGNRLLRHILEKTNGAHIEHKASNLFHAECKAIEE